MTRVPKVSVPQDHTEARVESPAGSIELLAVRNVPGGGWHHVMYQKSGAAAAKPTVVLYCPKCGHEGYLDDFSIDDDGLVQPSLICPVSSCDFHDIVKLEGYEA